MSVRSIRYHSGTLHAVEIELEIRRDQIKDQQVRETVRQCFEHGFSRAKIWGFISCPGSFNCTNSNISASS